MSRKENALRAKVRRLGFQLQKQKPLIEQIESQHMRLEACADKARDDSATITELKGRLREASELLANGELKCFRAATRGLPFGRMGELRSISVTYDLRMIEHGIFSTARDAFCLDRHVREIVRRLAYDIERDIIKQLTASGHACQP